MTKTEMKRMERNLKAREAKVKKLEQDLIKRMNDWGNEAITEELKNSRDLNRYWNSIVTWSVETKNKINKICETAYRLEAKMSELFQAVQDLQTEVSRRRLRK